MPFFLAVSPPTFFEFAPLSFFGGFEGEAKRTRSPFWRAPGTFSPLHRREILWTGLPRRFGLVRFRF